MKWKNRIWKRMIIGGGAVFLLASARSGIYAAEKDGAAVELSVHQTVYEEETSEELEGLFEYDLTALEEGSPMPDDSQNNIYSFSMSGTENRKIGPMIFSHGGIYRYEVKQNISGKKENYRYDETVYTVEVYVKNEEHGLTAEVIVLNEAGSKCESIQFENTYTVPGTEMTPAPLSERNARGCPGGQNRGYKFVGNVCDPAGTGGSYDGSGHIGRKECEMLIAVICLAAMIGTILFMQGAYHNQEPDDREQEEFLREWEERKRAKRKSKK